MDLRNIAQTMLFKGMTEEELKLALTELKAKERTYSKDSLILHAGDRTDLMGLVLSGSVTIESSDIWGNLTILSHVGAGQFFAETYAMLPGEVLSVDVKANEDSKILLLNIMRALNISESCSWKEKLTANLLMITANKNLTLSKRSFHTSIKSARGRILSYLNAVSLQAGSRDFYIPFDRQQMADYLNLERTNMSKELGKMRDEGLIEFRKNHFRLLTSD